MNKKALSPTSREDVYALTAWTVKQLRRQFFVAPTGTKEWKGPYKTLQLATAVVAKKLSEEWLRRHTRLVKFHKAEF